MGWRQGGPEGHRGFQKDPGGPRGTRGTQVRAVKGQCSCDKVCSGQRAHERPDVVNMMLVHFTDHGTEDTRTDGRTEAAQCEEPFIEGNMSSVCRGLIRFFT